MKRERVEDGSWHNEEKETSEGGCGRREKIPARERAKRVAGVEYGGKGAIAWVKPRGDSREDGCGREKSSADRIASEGCIGGGGWRRR